MASALENEWNSYFFQLNEVEKKSVLLLIKTFIKSKHPVQERVSIEQYNKEIDEALASVAEGNFITQEEMEKRAAKW